MTSMRLPVIALLMLAAGGCGDQPEGPPLVVTDVTVLEPMAGMDMTAGYFVLDNRGSDTIRITAVTSPQFGRIEMHETIVENDIARMRPIGEIVVLPGERVVFEPGGRHLMLFEPRRPIGDVTLNFEDGGELLLSVDTVATER
jgi:copper(I)-binding protein